MISYIESLPSYSNQACTDSRMEHDVVVSLIVCMVLEELSFKHLHINSCSLYFDFILCFRLCHSVMVKFQSVLILCKHSISLFRFLILLITIYSQNSVSGTYQYPRCFLLDGNLKLLSMRTCCFCWFTVEGFSLEDQPKLLLK